MRKKFPYGKGIIHHYLKKITILYFGLSRNMNFKMCQVRFALSLAVQMYLSCFFVLIYIFTAISKSVTLLEFCFLQIIFPYLPYFTSSQILVYIVPLVWYSFWNSSFRKYYSEGVQDSPPSACILPRDSLKTLLSLSRTREA